eukprot:Tamp_04192.p1 GENE.Tamp_04192~~Tamp_04192.p1  ORF type:complete len:724 (+),score=141.91 Tamp_04192:82-2172(+)
MPANCAEIVLGHASPSGQLRLPAVVRCSGVSRDWREVVRRVLPTLRILDFGGSEARVSGSDVLGVARVAGSNLASVNLSGCKRLTATDVERVLALVAASCPGVQHVEVSGCGVQAQLRALAIRAQVLCGAPSPLALFHFIQTLAQERAVPAPDGTLPAAGPERCLLQDLKVALSQGPRPDLLSDLVPGRDALYQAVCAHGSAGVVAVLLSVCFPVPFLEEEFILDPGGFLRPRVFDCNSYETTQFFTRGTIVHFAAEQGDVQLLEVLISAGAGAKLNSREDRNGNTPLLLACKNGHQEFAEMLVKKGASVSAANAYGDTPLLLACKGRYQELAQELLKRGACASAANNQGDTPLLLACKGRDQELAQELLKRGACASAANKQGDTPLLAAVAAADAVIAELLVAKLENENEQKAQKIANLEHTVENLKADMQSLKEDLECVEAVVLDTQIRDLEAELAVERETVAKRANTQASRKDGANVLSLALVSEDEACVKVAFMHGPPRLEGQGAGDAGALCNLAKRLAQAFSDPAQIGAWIRGGASPRALMGEIGALLSSAYVDAAAKDQLEHVRAFLNHHEARLEDWSRSPVPEHLVDQLASQEPDATFGRASTPGQSAAVSTTAQARPRPCRRTLKEGAPVFDVTLSQDGGFLACAVGDKAVVRNVQTGFVVRELIGQSRLILCTSCSCLMCIMLLLPT